MKPELIVGLVIGAVILIALVVLAVESFSGGRGTPGDQIPAVSRTAPAIPIPTTIHGTTHRSTAPSTATGNPSKTPST